MKLELTSSAFLEGQTIPKKYTADGEDISPPLKWNAIPPGTKTYVVICDDPDAPAGTWVHWVIYNIPGNTVELPEKIPPVEVVFHGAKQGLNDFRRFGYGGPCPPHGRPHRYYFKLFALDTELHLHAPVTKKDVVEAMKGHVVGEGLLMGIYVRP